MVICYIKYLWKGKIMIQANKINFQYFTLLLVVLLINSGMLISAGTPKSESEIPVFSGATRDMKVEKERTEQMSWEGDKSLRSAILKIYITSASPEEVFSFYQRAIGGKEGSYDGNPLEIAPGNTTPVYYELEYYDERDFDDAMYDTDYGISKHLGTWRKQTLTKNRKPYKAGQWIKAVNFSWGKKEVNNDETSFYLIISDISFDVVPGQYKPTTEIEVQVTTSKSEQTMRDERDEEMDRETEQMSRTLSSKPPTEKDLGAPIYPGAKFDAESSAGMSAGNDYAMYIYLTADSPAKVVSFYEQKLKIKAGSTGGDHYMIPLKGELPIPDEGISIEPNTMFGGSAKTVITIQKRVETEE
jgi:hypothetical protein